MYRCCARPLVAARNGAIVIMPTTTPETAGSVEPIAVTIRRACELTGLGATSIWMLGKQKRIEILHVGRRALVTYRSLQRLLEPEAPPKRGRGRPRKSPSTEAST
jgi:hypothetical protein